MLLDKQTKDGITTEFLLDSDGTFATRTSEDIQPHLDRAAAIRANSSHWTKTVKQGFGEVAFIPNSVIVEWQRRGINFYQLEKYSKEIKHLLNTEFKYLKTVDKIL